MQQQLSLFAADLEDLRWSQPGQLPDRSGMYVYTHLIRGDDDPRRSPRPPGGRKDRAPHQTLGKTQPSHWYSKIEDLLRDEGPLTFNAISVLMLDLTADVTFMTPVDKALWNLVRDRRLVFSLSSPIRFRRVENTSPHTTS